MTYSINDLLLGARTMAGEKRLSLPIADKARLVPTQ